MIIRESEIDNRKSVKNGGVEKRVNKEGVKIV